MISGWVDEWIDGEMGRWVSGWMMHKWIDGGVNK